jgi:hypothetical protein
MRGRLGGLAACFTVALLSVGGVATAKTATAKAPLQAGSGDCGKGNPSGPLLGTVSFRRKGDKVSVTVAIKSGEPNTKYDVFLFGNGCHIVSPLAEFTTNAKGKKNASITFVVNEADEADTEFFVDVDAFVEGAEQEGSTPSVALP